MLSGPAKLTYAPTGIFASTLSQALKHLVVHTVEHHHRDQGYLYGRPEPAEDWLQRWQKQGGC
ncbi:hypothetical protein V6U78_12140 [Marinospirillum sp. MEB164]|uniref:Uncharacterized protein n=1 Tax=Marinospirillum alkalitolerans TaxID=3123374 RepID=A0ABW8Q0X6_9GAMM